MLNRQGDHGVTDNAATDKSNCLHIGDETPGGYEVFCELSCCPGLNWNAGVLQGQEDKP